MLHFSLRVSLIFSFFSFFFFNYSSSKNLSSLCLSFLLYSSFSFFIILILCLALLIFFSSMCHSRCCPNMVGQPFVPSNSSFVEVMVNKDFWGLLFYSNKLSVTLNAIVSGGLLWIYQEDSKDILKYFVHTSVGCLW